MLPIVPPIIPKMEIKRLEECDPGELVREEGTDGWGLATLLKNDEGVQHGLIQLFSNPPGIGLRMPPKGSIKYVLSFGHGYDFIVDPRTNYKMGSGDNPIQKSIGAVRVYSDAMFMNIADGTYYDLATRLIMEEGERAMGTQTVTFGGWKMCWSDPLMKDYQPIYDFNLKHASISQTPPVPR